LPHVTLYLEQNPTIANLVSIEEAQWQSWFQIWITALDISHVVNSLDSLPSLNNLNNLNSEAALLPEPGFEISLRLTDDEEMQQFNATYRHLDRTTDVLAFAALETKMPEIALDKFNPTVDNEAESDLDSYLNPVTHAAFTFPGEGVENADHAIEPEPIYLGDLVISVPTAIAQAQEYGRSLPHELAWLAAHGLLHLLGWDHPDQASLANMLNQQERLLDLCGFYAASS
jgi:probable rRNA maturation factor